MKQITISRWTGDDGKIKRRNWRDLIASLCLAGYEVYGDKDRIVFSLSEDDYITEIKEKE